MNRNVSKGFFDWFQSIYKYVAPSQAILLSFLAVIATGTLLLSLPIASASGESAGFMTPLFTTTSAVCVTGLVVVETAAYWSVFGKTVIIGLIQVGGLGLITMLMLFLILSGKKVTLRDRLVIQAALNQDNLKGLIRLTQTVVFGTLLVEGIAAFILTLRFLFLPDITFFKALGLGIFHAISAFCNAGFDILGSDSIKPFVGDPIVNLVIMGLIVVAGLGFSVWNDVIHSAQNRPPQQRTFRSFFRSLRLQSKMVLTITGALLLGGAVFFFVVEYNNPATLGALSLGEKIWASFFHSVTLRTAGFYSVDIGALTHSSKFVSVLLMAIGGSPAGTAGGIKTVTMGVLFFSVLSAFRGKDSAHAFHRKISNHNVLKALTVFSMFLAIVILATIGLSLTEQNMVYTHDFMDFLFEVTSATGTVGLTTGITPHLSVPGQLIIISCMYLGRTGPFTMVLAMNRKLEGRTNRLDYPEEDVLIG